MQKYKLFHYIPREQARSEGKELDRTFGLDNYDIHARQYFAIAPMWDSIDLLTEELSSFEEEIYNLPEGRYIFESVRFVNVGNPKY